MEAPKFSHADESKADRQPTHGFCPRCGFLAELHDGRIGWHEEIRIKGFRSDGKPREYITQVPCAGRNTLPDPIHKEN